MKLDMNQQALAYVLAPGKPLTNTGLAAQGLAPEGATYNTNYYIYRDNFITPLQAVGLMNRILNLFTRNEGQGAARNVRLPTNLALVFFNYVTKIFIDFQLDPALNLDDNPLQGQYLASAINVVLQATRLQVESNQSGKIDVALSSFANFQVPAIVTAVEGQAAPAPLVIFPFQFAQFMKKCLLWSPVLIWPSVANLKMKLITDVEGWYDDAISDVAGNPAFDPAVREMAVKLRMVWSYECEGVQVRTNM